VSAQIAEQDTSDPASQLDIFFKGFFPLFIVSVLGEEEKERKIDSVGL